jgi:hypothetical protein
MSSPSEHSLLDFSDAAWSVPNVTLLAHEEKVLLATLCKMANNGGNTLHGADIAKVLLEAERLLTPRQAKAVFDAIKHKVVADWRRVEVNPAILVASFLTKPEDWQSIHYATRNKFWSDGYDACSWANTCLKPTLGKPTYAAALTKRARDRLDLRLAAGPIFSKTLPGSVLARAGDACRRRPALPPELCEYVLALAEAPPPHPCDVTWLESYNETWTMSKRAIAMMCRAEGREGEEDEQQEVEDGENDEVVVEYDGAPGDDDMLMSEDDLLY